MESQQLVYPIKWPQSYKNAFQPNNHFNKTVHDIIWLFWSETRVSVMESLLFENFVQSEQLVYH